MTDLNKILDDINASILEETDPQVTIQLNKIVPMIEWAIQYKRLKPILERPLRELGLKEDRVAEQRIGERRRHGDEK